MHGKNSKNVQVNTIRCSTYGYNNLRAVDLALEIMTYSSINGLYLDADNCSQARLGDDYLPMVHGKISTPHLPKLKKNDALRNVYDFRFFLQVVY